VEHSELIEMCASGKFDLFLSLSLQEGCSIALLESIGVGLPVLTTDTGNAMALSKKWKSIFVSENAYDSILELDPEVIEHLGYQVSPKNMGYLTKLLQEFKFDFKAHSINSHNQVLDFRKEYSLFRFAKNYIKAYSSI
jgi:glycosyltransferase involved in cell wall biosynthesis